MDIPRPCKRRVFLSGGSKLIQKTTQAVLVSICVTYALIFVTSASFWRHVFYRELVAFFRVMFSIARREKRDRFRVQVYTMISGGLHLVSSLFGGLHLVRCSSETLARACPKSLPYRGWMQTRRDLKPRLRNVIMEALHGPGAPDRLSGGAWGRSWRIKQHKEVRWGVVHLTSHVDLLALLGGWRPKTELWCSGSLLCH